MTTKIYTVQDLQDMANNLAGEYELANNINASGYDFLPVGDLSNKFTGTFDGGGYTISNLTIDQGGHALTPTRIPTSDDSVSGTWTVYPASPTTLYDKVETADEDTSYIASSSVGSRVLFGFSAFSVPSEAKSIAVRVYIRRKRTGGSGSSQQFIRLGGTNYDSSSVSAATSYGTTSSYWGTNPATGNSWTSAEVNNIQGFGVSIAGGDVRFTQIYLYVSFRLDYLGLFGYAQNATLENVTFENCSITGSASDYVGSLVGYANACTVQDIKTDVVIRGLYRYVGGVIGYARYSPTVIARCEAVADIYSDTYGRLVGGVCGYVEDATVADCGADVIIDVVNYYIGGIFGGEYNSTSTRCYATGSINTLTYAGGLTGYLYGSISNSYSTVNVVCSGSFGYSGGFVGENYGSINMCYSTGLVDHNATVGGFCGYNSGSINNCFWNTETSGQLIGIGEDAADITPWVLTTNRSNSGDYSVYCGDPDTFLYSNNQLSILELKDSVNLSATTSPSLSFYLWPDIESNYDYLYLDVSTDNGSTWTENVWSHTGRDQEWLSENIDLSSFKHSQVKIRFRFTSDSSVVYEGPYIDDVVITDGGSTIFSDGFESGDGSWILVPVVTGPEGKTTSEMRTQSTFTYWDFITIWGIKASINDGYPYLRWGVEPAPNVDFVSDIDSGCIPFEVSFTDTSTTDPTTWSWDFGDGKSSNEQNPTNIYDVAGLYTVTLTASGKKVYDDFEWGSDGDPITDSGGGIGWINASGVDLDNVIQISTTTAYSGTRSMLVRRVDKSISVDFEHPTGSGYTFAGRVVSSLGSDNYILHGTDSGRLFVGFDTSGYLNYNDGSYHIVSGASLTADVWSLIELREINWDSGTYDVWLDGGIVSEDTPMAIGGEQDNIVRFASTVGSGSFWWDEVEISYSGSATKVITAREVPTPDFTASVVSGYVPLEVDFTDTTSGYVTFWAWDFGDGGESLTQNPTHTYERAGIYSVKLQSSNLCGSDIETKANYITVIPKADFSASPVTGYAPLSVRFTDLTTGSPTGWSWDINNDGSEDYDIQNPKHTYGTRGKYSVTLTATGDGGVSDTVTKSEYINVTTPPEREKQLKTPIIEAIITRFYEGQKPGTDSLGFNYEIEVISCDMTHGFDQATSSCTLVIKSPYDADGNLVRFSPMDRVRIRQGWNVASTLKILFLGFVDKVEMINPGNEQRLECRDILKLPQDNYLIHSNRKVYFHEPVPDELDEDGNPMGGQPAGERSCWYIIRNLLIESGIGAHRQILDPELKNIIIGNNAIAVFVYESALDAIIRICDLVGYRIWADQMGCVRCAEVSSIATETPAVVYRSKREAYNEDGTWRTLDSGDLLSISSMRDDDLRNWVTVVGWDELQSTVVGDSPYVADPPKYRRTEIRTYLLDTHQLLIAVANRIYNELNRLRYTASAQIEGDQRLSLGVVVRIYDPFATYVEINYILHSFSSSFTTGNWTMDLNLVGGVGEGSPPSGRIAPIAVFNYTVAREKLADGYAIEVTVDASASYSPEGFGLSYLWTCEGFSDSTNQIHVYEVGDSTDPLEVTLKVTDDDPELPLSSTITLTIYLLGEEGAEITAQAIYAVHDTKIYSTVDSGVNWLTDDIGEVTTCVAACHRTRVGFVGTQDGNLWRTNDGVVWYKIPLPPDKPAGAITAVAVDKRANFGAYFNSATVYFAIGTRLYRTTGSGTRWDGTQWYDDPYSWQLMYTFPTTIRKIRTNNASMWRPVIGCDDGVWISTNAGVSWVKSLGD